MELGIGLELGLGFRLGVRARARARARARSSAPEPGNHSLMKLREAGFCTTLQSVKPAAC